MTRECSTCQHSFVMQQGGNPGHTICRRYPPTVLLLNMQGPVTPQNPSGMVQIPNGVPAPVAPNWICGEYFAKEAGVEIVRKGATK